MNVFQREIKSAGKAFATWTAAIAAMIAVVMLMFPEMTGDMSAINESFANMGSFTSAFGLDVLQMSSAMGFYGIESGNIVGLGTAMFAALIGISALAKEEGNHSAEFLLSHPIKRRRVVTEKLLAVCFQIILMNLIITAVAALSFVMIKEELELDKFLKLHLSITFMNLQLACTTFMISAFLKGGGAGIGLGLALLMYTLAIIANITESARNLKYVTPFKYSEAAQIFQDNALQWELIALGMGFSLVCVLIAYVKYTKKDIQI
ncbi:MAG: ABC transporter permease subunit [Bacillota bacterium]|nr:ABC transporter permease subunit [Bacillota bacterium]